jgi:hypothetical protein
MQTIAACSVGILVREESGYEHYEIVVAGGSLPLTVCRAAASGQAGGGKSRWRSNSRSCSASLPTFGVYCKCSAFEWRSCRSGVASPCGSSILPLYRFQVQNRTSIYWLSV